MIAQDPPLPRSEPEGRTRILRAAYALFVEHGFKAVSMQQIADAASIHKATLYHHFASKEALFSAVVVLAFSEMHEEVEGVIAAGGTAAHQLVQVACQVFARTQSDFGRLMTDAQENIAAEQRKELMRGRSFPQTLLRQIVAEGVRTGELPAVDEELSVSMFIGLVWGQIWVRKLDQVEGPLDERLATTLVDILFAGLRTSPLAVAVSPTRVVAAAE